MSYPNHDSRISHDCGRGNHHRSLWREEEASPLAHATHDDGLEALIWPDGRGKEMLREIMEIPLFSFAVFFFFFFFLLFPSGARL